jgi:crotonobetainyl-CoA:carnitine CoA-transferase CaiB-like acyl-CoA transferase
MLVEVPHFADGTLPFINSPMKIPTSPTSVRYPPPVLGQHTEEILEEMLGYDQETVNSLHDQGVV